MIIYKYDSGGFYTRTATLGDDDRDPLDTDNYLIPAGATTVSPPELQPNQAARLVDGEWSVLPDFAGVTYYLDDAEHVMSERGVELPAGAALQKPQSIIAQELQSAKFTAISLIEQKANEFHALVIGTADKSREARFTLNLECAKKLIAGTATAAEQQMLQLQYDANKTANHPIIRNLSFSQFAQWIVSFEQITTLGAGLIEATLIKGRAAVNAAQSIEEIEQIKQQLAAQAQADFEQLQAQFS